MIEHTKMTDSSEKPVPVSLVLKRLPSDLLQSHFIPRSTEAPVSRLCPLMFTPAEPEVHTQDSYVCPRALPSCCLL